jgi:hypothetical protein
MPIGSCLCGGVRYEVTGALGPVAMCHCGMCRKASGTAFATNASVAEDGFRVLAGEELVRGYESSPGATRSFCGRCGSPLWKRDAAKMPGQVRIRLGSLDDDPGVRPAFHWAVDSKAPWYEITDDLPQLVDPAAKK